MKDEPYCAHCKPKVKWYKRPLNVTILVTALLILSSFYIPLLEPFRVAFIEFWGIIWWAVLLGLLIGGIIEVFIPREYISKYLAKSEKKTILFATLLGFIMSACSHGILAISMELYKKGASTPSVIAFLMASPWANLPVTIMLFAFFGVKGLFFIFAAIVIAIITGLIFQLLDRANLIEKSKYSIKVSKQFSVLKDVKRRWKKYRPTYKNITRDTKRTAQGSWMVAQMVLWWILIGTILAAAFGAYIPHEIFQKYLGATLLGMLATLLLATIIEVCSEGSAPLAFEIFRQTGAFGNAFIFLMAGVITDCLLI
jgi:uncharacterized membrane protein YraQ (UPF0718 family)